MGRKRILKYIVCLSTVFILSACGQRSVTQEGKAADINVDILGEVYSGSYEGQIQSGLPNGEGSFSSDNTENDVYITGKWEDGALTGKATIIFEGDISKEISARFKNGVINGKVTETYKDGSYIEYNSNKGKPYGRIKEYSSEGELEDIDWFFDGERISRLVKEAKSIEYRDLISKPDDFLFEYIKIEGSVLACYDDADRRYLKIEDQEGNLYLCTYNNSTIRPSQQVHVPNLNVGDRIVLYGIYKGNKIFNTDALRVSKIYLNELEEGISINSIKNRLLLNSNNSSLYDSPDIEKTIDYDFENTLPYIDLFFGEVDGEQWDQIKLSYKYDEIMRHPYEYFGEEIRVVGYVLREKIDYDEDKVELMLQEEGTSNLYYCTMLLKDNSNIPILNERISCTAVIKGNHKIINYNYILNEPYYTIYPRILIKSTM